ncbi:MAG: aldo/keto reductase, partial [Lachnospiraceae bacterium]|nr:aldo/keto reductase [Lachnospiraceae bacterium]
MLQRYVKQLEMRLSPLGFGVMRLPQNPDGSFPASTISLLHRAYECGINYFDTGYEYLRGESESLIRDALVLNYSRDSFCIADKLPVWRISSRDDMERIFATQLERLGTQYIDFYLLHAMNASYWRNMQKLHVLEFLDAKKRSGQIRKIGFSLHDNEITLENMLSAYDWDFCQLQINYYDWYAQHAIENYRLCEEREIPILVMEPIGGGRLIKLPPEAEQMVQDCSLTPSQLALRFLMGLSDVAVTLTGAITEEQLNENIATVSDIGDIISNSDDVIFENIVKIIQSKSAIPCTACKYCNRECPQKVDIPLCFQKYNDYKLLGLPSQYTNLGEFYFNCVPEEYQASNCIACGRCVKRCPQHINIPSELKKVHIAASAELIGVSPDELSNKISGNTKIVCFGAGGMGKSFINILSSFGYKVDYLCDNSSELWGKKVDSIEIISPKRLADMY